ncbi:heparinase II/III domain-containing protein [Terrimicrobium sacchariphilum]|nr:heparinase II/III family protein [Terrimicrobium sacchariphilum]
MISPILLGIVKADPAVLPHPLPDHPRLLVAGGDWEKIRRQIEADPLSGKVFALVRENADRMLDQPPVERTLVGRRLLDVSRLALERITALAMVAQITGDERYSSRAIEEMLAVIKFSDWNPSHFLDVAEMSLAVAIGYDWLYDKLTPDQRDEIAKALVDKGIRPSFVTPEPFFVQGTNNWNQVCHAGLSAAAIAVADREPALAEKVLERAIRYLPNAAESYAPDGAFLEGPMYWDYGTMFHVVLAASLERLTGSTQGVADYPGFAASADYMQQVVSPIGRYFCYSDCRSNRGMQLPLFWFARHFHRPDWIAANAGIINAQPEKHDGKPYNGGRLFPLALLWLLPSDGAPAAHEPAPLRWYARGRGPLVVFRSAFGDPNAFYFAIKGGSPSLSHAHMDAGSFNLTADGVEWATDLGMQEYESLEKLQIPLWDRKGGRWGVFRLGPESHSIPRFNGARPLVDGDAIFQKVQLEGKRPFALLDLTPLYQDQVAQAERGVMVLNDKVVLIQDEWKGRGQETDYSWQFMTRADVQVDGRKVHLRKDGKSLDLLVLDESPVTIKVEKAEELMQPFDAPNPDVKRVNIHLKTASDAAGRLRVLAVPGSSGTVEPPALQPLKDWK